MNALMRFKPLNFITCSLVVFVFLGCSKGPAPYSQEAIVKLNSAALKAKTPVIRPGMTPCDKLKMAYEALDDIYSEAGYSLEKSIIQFKETDPQYRANSPEAAAVNDVLFQNMYPSHELAIQENFKLEECIPRKAAVAINDTINDMFRSERATTLNSDAKNAYIAAAAYVTEHPNATITDCATLMPVGYQPSKNITCSTNISLFAGDITITGPTAWGLTKNISSIDYAGALDEAIP